MGHLGRFTRDVDLTVSLDFDEFERLTMRLAAIEWAPLPKLEHRWVAPRPTIIDLLPAGAELRRSGSITWPASQFKMSLAGFEHVFAHAIEVHLPGRLAIRVAPPIVTALLKIIAWVDDRTGAPRIFRIFVLFSAATNKRLTACSPTPCSMRTFRISSSRTPPHHDQPIRRNAIQPPHRPIQLFVLAPKKICLCPAPPNGGSGTCLRPWNHAAGPGATVVRSI